MHIADVFSQAVRTTLSEGRHLPTVLVAFDGLPAPVRHTFFSFPDTPERREQTLFLQGKQLAESYGDRVVQRVWFIDEGWMNIFVPHSGQQVVRPSQDPRRREVLFVVELDATSGELLQRVEVQEMRRNQSKKLINLDPVPELSGEQGQISPLGVPVLRFLEGFSEKASSHPEVYGPLRARIRLEKVKMAIMLGHARRQG